MTAEQKDMLRTGLGSTRLAADRSDSAEGPPEAMGGLWDDCEPWTRDWREIFGDDAGQATVETLLLLGAVVLPFAVGAYFWVDITRHLWSRNAKYLALPFP